MMKRPRRVLALVAVAVAAAGCPSSSPEVRDALDEAREGASVEPPVESGPTELLALVPAGAVAVLRADLTRIRTSPYWEVVTGWIEQVEEALGQAEGEGGDLVGNIRVALAAFRATDLAIIAIVPGPQGAGDEDDDPDAVLLLRGRYEEGQLDRVARLVGRDDEGKSELRAEQRGEHRVLVLDEAAATALDTNTWVVGTSSGLDQVLGRVEGASAGGVLSATLRAAAERVRFEDAMASAIVELTDDLRSEIEQEISEAEDLVSAGLRVEAQQGIGVEAEVLGDNPEVVVALEQDVRRYLQETAQQLSQGGAMADLGLRQVLESAQVRAEGNRLLVSAHVDDQTTRAVLDFVGNFVGLLVALAGAMDSFDPGMLAPPGGGLSPSPPPQPTPVPGQP